MTAVNDLAAKLAMIKAASEILAAEEVATKAAIREHLGPGDRKKARVGDADVATVTVAEHRPALRVVDARLFTRWVEVHHPDAVETVVRSSDQRAILADALKTGDLPDGVDLAPPRDPVVTVRMTDAQAANLEAALRSGTYAWGNLLRIGQGGDA